MIIKMIALLRQECKLFQRKFPCVRGSNVSFTSFQCGRKGQGPVYTAFESLKKILRASQCAVRLLAAPL